MEETKQTIINDIKEIYFLIDGFEPNHNFDNYSLEDVTKLRSDLWKEKSDDFAESDVDVSTLSEDEFAMGWLGFNPSYLKRLNVEIEETKVVMDELNILYKEIYGIEPDHSNDWKYSLEEVIALRDNFKKMIQTKKDHPHLQYIHMC